MPEFTQICKNINSMLCEQYHHKNGSLRESEEKEVISLSTLSLPFSPFSHSLFHGEVYVSTVAETETVSPNPFPSSSVPTTPTTDYVHVQLTSSEAEISRNACEQKHGHAKSESSGIKHDEGFHSQGAL